jgi:hypothetical protein
LERSAQLLLGPVKSPGRAIYDISSGGMQPGEPENRQVWLTGDRMTDRRGRVASGYLRLEIDTKKGAGKEGKKRGDKKGKRINQRLTTQSLRGG